MIQLPDTNKAIKFIFNNEWYGIEGTPPACDTDWVEILNGGENGAAISVGRFCGNQCPQAIVSSINMATVIFRAGTQHSSDNSGAQLSYQTVDGPNGTC